MSNVPKQKPGNSNQSYGTPWVLVRALEKRFGPMTIDLAATSVNAKAPRFITPEEDSLSVDWAPLIGTGNAWLNPPFGRVAPWARKCAEYGARGYKIYLLTPYGVQDWFVRHVLPNARRIELYGRITFVGEKQGYVKDCRISCFGHGRKGSEVWDWRRGGDA